VTKNIFAGTREMKKKKIKGDRVLKSINVPSPSYR